MSSLIFFIEIPDVSGFNMLIGVIISNFVPIGQTVVGILPIFNFFKMAAVRHLAFLKVENFNFRCGSEGQYASSCQILRRSVKPSLRYGRVGTTHEEYLVVFVTVQKYIFL